MLASPARGHRIGLSGDQVMTDRIHGLHHITLCTSTAQGDANFFVKVLGMTLIKRTLLYDGMEPVYHLYFSDPLGASANVTTSFPWRRTGRKARPGTGQFSVTSYSVPKGSLAFWRDHLTEHKVPIRRRYERFGQAVLQFEHPECGLAFEMVEDATDLRRPYPSKYVPPQFAIRGFHSWTVTMQAPGDMPAFMNEAWNFRKSGTDGAYTRYEVDNGGSGQTIDLLYQPEVGPGSWMYGEGMVHHGAFAVNSIEIQDRVKAEIEGLGFTDCSDRKDRTYFKSIYIRSPSGALFEAAVHVGFTVDEPEATLGTEFMISPQFHDKKEELLARLNDPILL
jgi:catechol 2,3-dioxygenase-like lactoylglutathione lyase family enzyme